MTAQTIGLGDVLLSLLYLIIILVAVYYTTKFLARKAQGSGVTKKNAKNLFSGKSYKDNRILKMTARLNLDRDKTLVVVEFEDKQYLIAANNTVFKVISVSDIKNEPEPDTNNQEKKTDNAEETKNREEFIKKYYGNKSFTGKVYEFLSKKRLSKEIKNNINTADFKQSFEDAVKIQEEKSEQGGNEDK